MGLPAIAVAVVGTSNRAAAAGAATSQEPDLEGGCDGSLLDMRPSTTRTHIVDGVMKRRTAVLLQRHALLKLADMTTRRRTDPAFARCHFMQVGARRRVTRRHSPGGCLNASSAIGAAGVPKKSGAGVAKRTTELQDPSAAMAAKVAGTAAIEVIMTRFISSGSPQMDMTGW